MNIRTFDIVEYLKHLGIPYWEAGENVSRGWLGIQCPYCDDHHNHLGINLTYMNFSCWRCNTTGSLPTLIMDLEGVPFREARHRIDEFQTLYPHEPEEKERLQKEQGVQVLPLGCLDDLTKNQRKYLKGRRFDPDLLRDLWGITGGPPFGPWKHRIIIPVPLQGQIMTFVGMASIAGAQTKYKAADVRESFIPVSELVYGADHAGKNVLVVEGCTDVWRMGPGTVGLFGMIPTEQKVNALLELEADNYYIMLDGESRAARNAKKLAKEILNRGRGEVSTVEVLELSEGDPDNLSDEQAEYWRNELKIGV